MSDNTITDDDDGSVVNRECSDSLSLPGIDGDLDQATTSEFFDGLKSSQDLSPPESFVLRRRKKRTRKAKPQSQSWEQLSGTSLTDERQSADPELGLPGIGEARVRRIRRRKGRLLYRFVKRLRLVVWIAGAIIILTLLWFALPIAYRAYNSGTETVSTHRSASTDPRFPAIQRDQARAALEQYLGATTWEKQLQFVRVPERIRPLMKAHYATHPYRPRLIHELLAYRWNASGEKSEVYLAVNVLEQSADQHDTPELNYFVLESSADGYRVDWETAVNYAPMSLEDFQKSGVPGRPAWYRVLVNRSDYYNAPFREEEWISFELTYPRSDFLLYGYAQRGTSTALDLIALCREKGSGRIIVDVQPPTEPSMDPKQVEIIGIRHRTWLY